MTFRNTRWQSARPAPAEYLRSVSDIADPFVAQILYNRGITDPTGIQAFLERRVIDPASHDPFRLTDMKLAVERIRQAIHKREKIAVYGDYDADGVTASVLLVQTLRSMGAASVYPYIPSRAEEGYGLNNDALEDLARRDYKLVVTVDCGIRATKQVRHAAKWGLDLIITDHHAPGTELPPALAVINPKRDRIAALGHQAYGDPMLAGVGVAYKLFQALKQEGLIPENLTENTMLDLVAVGTIADLVPLVKENRDLVHRGLAVINKNPRPGIAALLETAGIRPGEVTATTVGFVLGPRINAAGRLSDATAAGRLLITKSTGTARQLADQLDQLNRSRQKHTQELIAIAEELVAKEDDPPLIFASDTRFLSGVAGLVASRLVERHYRPTIIAEIKEDVAVASCRSIPEFHITRALDRCGDLLEKHGGHAAAAGFTVKVDKLALLKKRLIDLAAAQLRGEELVAKLTYDMELTLSDTHHVLRSLMRLEPCGYQNPTPLLFTRGAVVADSRTVGVEGKHLKLRLSDGDRGFDAIAFGMGEFSSQIQERMDIVYHLEENEWNGRVNLQLNIQDMRPAGEASE
jgi:single-stranded-DNA-specific exonuclease